MLFLLSELDRLARADGVILEIDIYGGSAFLLAYDSRAVSKDIDAIIRPESEAKRYVIQLAEKHGLPDDWLNSSVCQFLTPLTPSLRKLDIGDFAHLRMRVPTAKYLLALKAKACREPIGKVGGDYEDIRFLVNKMEIKGVSEIQDAIDAFFLDDPLTNEQEHVLQNIVQSANGPRL